MKELFYSSDNINTIKLINHISFFRLYYIQTNDKQTAPEFDVDSYLFRTYKEFLESEEATFGAIYIS
jgi:hypothetical protein